jgi:hypothetical protein
MSNLTPTEELEALRAKCTLLSAALRKSDAEMEALKAGPIDRGTAHRLNPLISELWTNDTLTETSSLMRDLGFFLSVCENPQDDEEYRFGRVYLMFGAIAAALEYEADNPNLCRPSH